MENNTTPQVVIIVPCYNEEKRLESKAFTNFVHNNSNYSVCFVNDGSKDNTSSLLKDLCKQYPNKLMLIDNNDNRGKAEAIRCAMTQLHDKYTYIGFCDADLATPLEEFTQLYNACSLDYPIIFGSRIKRLGAHIERNITRHYIGRCFATAVSIVFNIPVYDSQCGAKLFHCDSVQALFDKPFQSTWLFDVEILVRTKLKYGNYSTVKEIPLSEWKEKGGSKINFSYWFKAPFILMKLFSHYKSEGYRR
ncbi:MAG: dolichyl-phosphate beta-glucosyltransferase [Marinifilaceae bacterium]